MRIMEMRVSLMVLVSVGVLCVHCVEIEYEFVEEWRLWKTEHGRTYHAQPEELERHLVWLSNKKYIEVHNKNSGIFGYTLSMNGFGDMVSQDMTHGHSIHTC